MTQVVYRPVAEIYRAVRYVLVRPGSVHAGLVWSVFP